jgi:hypothetical protein
MNMPESVKAALDFGAQHLTSSDPTAVGDERFIHQLDQVRKLKRFLFEERIRFNPDQLDSIDLGPLNNLRFSIRGRAPSDLEWRLLDEKLAALSHYLDDGLRQKVRIGELSVFFGTLPVVFLVSTIVSIIFYFTYPSLFAQESVAFRLSFLVCLIIWTLSQGGLGACAFLGTRAAVKRSEGAGSAESLSEAIDVTDKSVLQIRVILGALFAFLVGLPFAFQALEKISAALFTADGVKISDITLVVVPFTLGFSTNLALVVLDRFVATIRTLLGVAGAK